MSGGAFNYEYYRFNEAYSEQMNDPILNELIEDLTDVLHDLEWYESGDYSEIEYRETVNKFKDKWIRKKQLKKYLDTNHNDKEKIDG